MIVFILSFVHSLSCGIYTLRLITILKFHNYIIGVSLALFSLNASNVCHFHFTWWKLSSLNRLLVKLLWDYSSWFIILFASKSIVWKLILFLQNMKKNKKKLKQIKDKKLCLKVNNLEAELQPPCHCTDYNIDK